MPYVGTHLMLHWQAGFPHLDYHPRRPIHHPELCKSIDQGQKIVHL
jgi:hypothetical protein